MGFPSFRRFPHSGAPRQLVCSTRSIACVFIAVLTAWVAPAATAQTGIADTSSVPPAVESQRKDLLPVDSKKVQKYDVDRIGDRGIGRGFNLYSVRQEQELGERLAAIFERNSRIVNDLAVSDYVNRIGQKIARNSDAEVPFTIKVIDSDDIPRAYGLPGGFLYVNTALILAADGEAELASVMAREIAHVAARHATRALTRKRLCNLIDSVAFLVGPAGVGVEDVGSFAGPLSVKKFNRDAEYEADLLGVEYAYAAGYDPEALLDALEKLHAIELRKNALFAKIPGYHLATKLPFHHKIARSLSNYPLTEERIERLQSEIPTFLPDRRDYVVDTEEFQEVKSHLLAASSLVLRRHSSDDEGKGPVLRRNTEYKSDVRLLSTFADLPQSVEPLGLP